MSIEAADIQKHIDAIAGFTATPGEGASRPTFSRPWRAAVDYVASRAEAAGCDTRTDAFGNVHLRPTSLGWDAPAWLSGSHLDSVPHGGDWDGVIGVVAPLAALENDPSLPLELVIFAEEEGTTFGLGMLGSRAWVGDLSRGDLEHVRNANGLDYLQAGIPHGVRPENFAADLFDPAPYRGLIEIHAEQGPGLWNAGHPLAVVEAVAGRRQYRVTLTGQANHAGSTSMADRRDALAAAAEIMVKLELLADELGGVAVATVGRLSVEPNAVNVVPGRVAFTIDFRTPDARALDQIDGTLRGMIDRTCETRQIDPTFERTEQQPPALLDESVCEKLESAAAACGFAKKQIPRVASGALHDAAILAPHLPTAMLFVPSRGGISHNPQEFSRAEDVALAARVLEKLVLNSS